MQFYAQATAPAKMIDTLLKAVPNMQVLKTDSAHHSILNSKHKVRRGKSSMEEVEGDGGGGGELEMGAM
jgi:hypothetical protein